MFLQWEVLLGGKQQFVSGEGNVLGLGPVIRMDRICGDGLHFDLDPIVS